eukprot:2835666-Alexandrium_andersonii.AAC.1
MSLNPSLRKSLRKLGLSDLSSRSRRCSSEARINSVQEENAEAMVGLRGIDARRKAILAQKTSSKEPKAEYVAATVRPEM